MPHRRPFVSTINTWLANTSAHTIQEDPYTAVAKFLIASPKRRAGSCPKTIHRVTLTFMRGAILLLLTSTLVGCGEDLDRRDDNTTCPEPPADPTAARVFAIQPRISPERFDSYESYQTHLVELTRTHVAPCLARDRSNIIVFPENTGLPAAFIGSRGEAARASTSAFAAFLALGGQYTQPIQFYKDKWPNVPLPTQIELGITDTVWRAFYETNSLIAEELGAWVIASTNVSGLVEKSSDPTEIAALADPDLKNVSYVYVARDPAVYNTAFVHAPDGSLVAMRKKPYLVASEKNDLALTPGPLRDALPIEIGNLGIGIFTSKDAWMPDLVDRLAALGADTFVQPEAFSGWTIPEEPSEPNVWAPEILSQSAMAAVRKHGAYRHGVVSHLTGNLFDMTFDGQSIIVGDPVPGELQRAYVGQTEEGGVLAVAPWVMADPIEEDPAATLDARRAKLRAFGQELLPGGPRANQYKEAVIAADLGKPSSPITDGPPGALGPSRPISNVGQAEQSNAAVAWTNTSPIVVVFQEGARGKTRIVAVTSEDQGKTFGMPHAVAASSKTQISPAVLTSGIYVYAAWQEIDEQGSRIACSISMDRGKTFGTPVYLPSEAAAPDSWRPALASSNGQVFLVYVDGSSGNERIMLAKAPEGTLAFTTSPIEMTKAHPAGDVRNNQWSPTVAANANHVAIAWVDFRNNNWDVFLSRSTDGGSTFAAPVRVDDGTDAPERLHDDAFAMFLPNVDPSTLAVGWSDVRLRNRHAAPRVSLVAGSAIGQSRRFGSVDASAYSPRIAPLGANKLAVVWQDDRTLGADIYLSTSSDAGANFGTELRIDDGGDGASHQTAPVIAGDGAGSVIVAWEDARSGQRRIRFALGKP